jgi:hypothetical protein
MIFEEVDKRTRKKYTVCSKYWPDGTRFRRRFSNKTLAKNVLNRIEGAIALGTRQDLKKELTEPPRILRKNSRFENSRTFTLRSIARSATRGRISRRRH